MKILFKIFPQKSHYNATFSLARELERAGHEIVYAGLASMRSHVEAQGFTYFTQQDDIFKYIEYKKDSPSFTFYNIIKNWREIRHTAKNMRRRFASQDAFVELLRGLKPDFVLVDSPYTFFSLPLYKHGVRFAILESMVNLARAPGCPPLDTSYVPRGNSFSRLICELHWQRYFLKRAFLGFIGLRIDFNKRFVRKTAAIYGIDQSVISFDRYFHIGLCNVPEFILSPFRIDFPRTPKKNQVYVDLPAEVRRQEVASDYRFNQRFSELVKERNHGVPLVYCCLGTAAWRYKGAERFLHRVVEAAKGRPWNLLIAIGNEFQLEQFTGLPRNVVIFQVVPQLQILQHANLMISHGGMNSITECLSAGVPMLVCPGTNEIDQAGNAARIVFHGVGLIGCMALDCPAAITRNVETILQDCRYARRAASLGVAIAKTAKKPPTSIINFHATACASPQGGEIAWSNKT